MGVLAVYGYGLPEIVDAQNTELNQIFREVSLTKNKDRNLIGCLQFYKKMRPYFPPDRAYIDNKYADIVLPYADKTRSVGFERCRNRILRYAFLSLQR